MVVKRLSLTLVFFIYLFYTSETRVIQVIDSLQDNNGGPIVIFVPFYDASPGEELLNEWYSPYPALQAGSQDPVSAFLPFARAFNTASAIGGQRDTIVGYQGDGTLREVAVAVRITNTREMDTAFPDVYEGAIFFQYDGDDIVQGQSPYPHGLLNWNRPGLGGFDLTQGGRAVGIFIQAISDHDCFYHYDIVSPNGEWNSLQFIVLEEHSYFISYYHRFDDPNWTIPGFDFSNIGALQLRITTELGAAPDTLWRTFTLVNPIINGQVTIECLCNGQPDDFVEDAVVTIQNGETTRTTLTDASGNYEFADVPFNLNPGLTWQVCLEPGFTLCNSQQRCSDVVIDDPTLEYVVNFITVTTTIMIIPADQNLDCPSCTTTDCTGLATLRECGGPEVTLDDDDKIDQITGNDCNRFINRIWTNPDDPNDRQTQIITVTDTSPPVITTQASNPSFDCASVGISISDWVAANGQAVATDNCNSITWTNNWNSQTPTCGAIITVTFIASDACELGNDTTGTYRITDTIAPQFTTTPVSSSAECDQKESSDIVFFNSWLTRTADSVATDNCGTPIITNNYVAGTLVSGCNNFVDVTFTATDACGLTADATARFTISDTTDPQITSPASNSGVQCISETDTQNAYNTWLSSRGGATATDACISNNNNLQWTDDGPTSISGCGNAISVTFTVTDPCGRTSRTTATFSVAEFTPPPSVSASNSPSRSPSLGESPSPAPSLTGSNFPSFSESYSPSVSESVSPSMSSSSFESIIFEGPSVLQPRSVSQRFSAIPLVSPQSSDPKDISETRSPLPFVGVLIIEGCILGVRFQVSSNNLAVVICEEEILAKVQITLEGSEEREFEYFITEVDPKTLPGWQRIISPVIDISTFDGVSYFRGKAEICFPKSPRSTSRDCLAFFNEKFGRWECVGDRLTEDPVTGLVCGTTPHFTNFALLLNGFPSGDDSGESDTYITGSWRGDLILVAAIGCCVIVLILIIVFLVTVIPPFERLVQGKEGYRISKLRNVSRSHTSVVR